MAGYDIFLKPERSRTALLRPVFDEPTIISLLYLTWVAMHLIFAFVYHVDSDELRHLHVIRGWAGDLFQYRDVFDNPAPLFHLLSVPLYKLFGEQPSLLLNMRLSMIPLSMITLAATYVIGRKLYDHRAGLWMTTWMLSLMLLFTGRMTKKRVFSSGLFLGITLAVSMKTIFLPAALGAAYFAANFMAKKSPRDVKAFYILFLAGFSLIPVACAIRVMPIPGGFGPFIYDVIGHNMVFGTGQWPLPIVVLFFILLLIFIYWGAKRFTDISTSDTGRTRLVLYFCLCFYLSWILSFRPLITPQDFLPAYPLFALIAIPPLAKIWGKKSAHLFRRITAERFSSDFLIVLIIVVLEIATISFQGG